MFNQLLDKLRQGDGRAISRAISLVENEAPGYESFLKSLPFQKKVNITGITGPPGAGKSTVVDQLIAANIAAARTVAVLCVDPSSPYTNGALLGDRIRMSEWYNHPSVFIRSLSSRGTLGGLNPGIIEICDVLKAAGFDQIIIETVGVGQNEIEITSLADITVVVLVPESGDEIQNMKAGLMEIADIFAVNKCDRPGADLFVKNLRTALHGGTGKEIPVVKMTAIARDGVADLQSAIEIAFTEQAADASRALSLLTEKAYRLVLKNKMKRVNKEKLQADIREQYGRPDFNLYRLVEDF